MEMAGRKDNNALEYPSIYVGTQFPHSKLLLTLPLLGISWVCGQELAFRMLMIIRFCIL